MSKIATREAYGKTLARLVAQDDHIFVLDADLSGSTKTAMAKKARPECHFNMGIAEGNMMSVAAGMQHREMLCLPQASQCSPQVVPLNRFVIPLLIRN